MKRTWLPLLMLVSACPSRTGTVRTPPTETDVIDTDGVDTDGATTPDHALADVSHDRELRGLWVATVWNIDFPSGQSLSAQQQQDELVDLLDIMQEARMNALFFQVRPEADAVYQSDLEPWSRYLTGTQGQNPGYDPLAFAIEQAHARNIEVHAWFNPYRAKSSSGHAVAANHPVNTLSEHVRTYGDLVWLDPGSEQVRDHTVAVILDVVDRYDVDGVHFDDYFYPYPNGSEFPDGPTWSAYQSGGGALTRDDWRRDNVNRLMEAVSDGVHALDKDVRFGISPFGIYRPGTPPGISGLDQYAEIYADPVHWVEQGWVDYLAPQLYWPTTQTAQAYGTLIEWWAAMPTDGQYTFAGLTLSSLGTSSSWTVDEYLEQVALSRAESANGSLGNIWFSASPLLDDRDGIRAVFSGQLYPRWASTPPLARVTASETATPPNVSLDAADLRLQSYDNTRSFIVYRDNAGEWESMDALPATATGAALPPGRYAVSQVRRDGVESQGVVLEVNAP